ncbi:MAG: Uma2 family endonuclease [Cyanobacteriota bacterium]|jgi:Uma2 family endonuclease
MLAPASPEAPPASLSDCPGPPCPGLLSPEQPFGAITLPLIHCSGLRLTPERFAELCQANPDAVLELAADGSLICMTPTGSDTGARNGELFFQIKSWARATGGWKAFDSSTGFRLPDDSVLSPDASLVALDRWQSLTAEQRRGFAPLCPDLVVELASPSDEGPRGLTALRQKMAAYQRNGARLGWLLIPEERAVEIWELLADPQAQPRRIEAATRLEGDAQFAGLALELEEIWAG